MEEHRQLCVEHESGVLFEGARIPAQSVRNMHDLWFSSACTTPTLRLVVSQSRLWMQLEQNQLAVIAGDKQQDGVYQLPTQIQSAAQEQYARDIARVHGVAVQSEEAEYQDFLASLGGGGGGGRGPPPGAFLSFYRTGAIF